MLAAPLEFAPSTSAVLRLQVRGCGMHNLLGLLPTQAPPKPWLKLPHTGGWQPGTRSPLCSTRSPWACWTRTPPTCPHTARQWRWRPCTSAGACCARRTWRGEWRPPSLWLRCSALPTGRAGIHCMSSSPLRSSPLTCSHACPRASHPQPSTPFPYLLPRWLGPEAVLRLACGPPPQALHSLRESPPSEHVVTFPSSLPGPQAPAAPAAPGCAVRCAVRACWPPWAEQRGA